VLQCVAVCCSVLQCVAVCCSVLQCLEHSFLLSYLCVCVCVCMYVCMCGGGFVALALVPAFLRCLVVVCMCGFRERRTRIMMNDWAQDNTLLQCVALHCNTLQHTATMQRSVTPATLGNTLQQATTILRGILALPLSIHSLFLSVFSLFNKHHSLFFPPSTPSLFL